MRLTYSDSLILIRNQNEIRALNKEKKRTIEKIDMDIAELKKQNRQILGRE